MLERENRELDERLAELYLEWITKTRGLATPAQNLTTAVITAKSLTRLPQGPNHEGGSDCSQPSLGMADITYFRILNGFHHGISQNAAPAFDSIAGI